MLLLNKVPCPTLYLLLQYSSTQLLWPLLWPRRSPGEKVNEKGKRHAGLLVLIAVYEDEKRYKLLSLYIKHRLTFQELPGTLNSNMSPSPKDTVLTEPGDGPRL